MSIVDDYDIETHPHPAFSPGSGRRLWLAAVLVRDLLPASALAWAGVMLSPAVRAEDLAAGSTSSTPFDGFVLAATISAAIVMGLYLLAPRLYRAAYDHVEHPARCATADCIGSLRWWEMWPEHLLSRLALVAIAVTLPLWSHPSIGVALAVGAGGLVVHTAAMLIFDAMRPPPNFTWPNAAATYVIDLTALAVLASLGPVDAFWFGLTAGAALVPVVVALCAVWTVLRHGAIGTRAPTIAPAPAGVVHCVDDRQHALDMLGRRAPTLVSWFTPNAPTAMCGGTLIVGSAEPDNGTSSLPACPDCTSILSGHAAPPAPPTRG